MAASEFDDSESLPRSVIVGINSNSEMMTPLLPNAVPKVKSDQVNENIPIEHGSYLSTTTSSVNSPTLKPSMYSHPPTCKIYVPHDTDKKRATSSSTATTPGTTSSSSPEKNKNIDMAPIAILVDAAPIYYCSEACGISIARHRLAASILGTSHSATTISTTPTAPTDAKTRSTTLQNHLHCLVTKKQKRGMKRAVVDQIRQKLDISAEKCTRLEKFSAVATATDEDDTAKAAFMIPSARHDAADRTRLCALQSRDAILKTRVRALEVWVSRIDDAAVNADCGCARDDEDGRHGPVCGFDRRIINEWRVPCVGEWMQLTEKERIFAFNGGGVWHEENKQLVDDSVCMIQGKCPYHFGWKILRVAEVETEINLAMQDIEKNYEDMKRVIDGMRDRRNAASKAFIDIAKGKH
ncbi:hypothetical protein HK100_001047 [Physocladia obscura]|uniref:Uncharacterized protein n=1 Tax=Physocladia obscura TaxID=109957 RepID=A0AAD5SZZ7_9FUNG|nr:hypothetical protein HK100_001047 [Physocladia obscura]